MMADVQPGPPARDRAAAAVELAASDPARAGRLGRQVLADAAADATARSAARRALGLAASACGRPAEAVRHLRAAVRTAERAGLAGAAARARMSLSYVLAITGATAAALRELDAAAPALSGIAAVELRMQRALVLTEVGRFDEAARGFADTMAALRRAGGDALLEADVRINRAILATHRRAWRQAEADLRRAEALYTAAGHPQRVALVHHNRGVAAAVRGDVPAALRHYDEAERRYRAAGRDVGQIPVIRAEVLLQARLAGEARAAAEAAAAGYAAARNATDLAQARIVLARAALLDGDPERARTEAERAHRAYVRLRRPGFAALARYVALRARWEGGDRGDGMLRAGRATVDALVAAGWAVPALDARLIVARIAIDRGRPRRARRELAVAAAARRRGPAELRAGAWHAEALLRLAAGDRRGAGSALRAGIAVLDRFRDGLGATELRAHAAGHAAELASTGLQLALDARRPDRVLGWAERWRAGALRRPPALPPDDAAHADGLAALRQVAAAVEEAAAAGRPVAPLLRRQAALEDGVRRRARHAPGPGPGAGDGPPSVADLAAVLGDAVLVEYVVSAGGLHAVVVADGRARLHDLGPVAEVERALAALRFGLRRMAYDGAGPAPGRPAPVEVAVDTAAGRLDSVLLGPLRARLAARPLVIVPTGALHAVPWAALPGCAARAVTVAPSAARWLRAVGVAPAGDGAPHVLAAGPGLPHAAAEVAALARRDRNATRLTGRRATVAAVTAALDGAGLAHLAAHGALRADNPQFSALRLADGPLTVYDLERLGAPPRTVVLSACESGLPVVGTGDEVLGLAAALLGLGTRSLIACVVPVPDRASRSLMLRMHQHLRRGVGPAAALARARVALPAATGAERVATAGFVCFGAG